MSLKVSESLIPGQTVSLGDPNSGFTEYVVEFDPSEVILLYCTSIDESSIIPLPRKKLDGDADWEEFNNKVKYTLTRIN